MVCWCVRTRVWKQTNKQTKKHVFNFLGRPFVMVSFAGCSGTGDCLRQEHVMKCVQIHGAECKICYFVCVRCVLMKNFISHTSFFFFWFSFFGKCVFPYLHPIELDDCITYQRYRTVFLSERFSYRCFRGGGGGAVQIWCPSYCTLSFDTLIPHISFHDVFLRLHTIGGLWRRCGKKIPDTWIDLGMDKGLVLMYYFLYCGSGQCLVGLLQGLVFFPYKSSTGYKTSRVHSMGKMVGTLAGCLGRALSKGIGTQ